MIDTLMKRAPSILLTLALMKAHFIEPSPAPIKAVLSLLGRCSETLRLPMVPVTDATRTKLKSLLHDLNLLPH